ncbi:2-amino-4-hydroxy-6-hydroxymethyldihydropteridine diphosphokinase [Flavobacterium sp. SUN046]|uniref:2-amino-4-hydroxy-6- hydroxymethyldihydropteridine diphosphokinase n=1 Tax=Flavobacterium sp. SUN046 TaxID=3002440 RepID=UPI002DB96AF1|nr:2-amino-4-hydroxy-6-hydroxymethyldihydropteridine diphosphokinase [Flavobacterium sp. SUN046]MEC4047802.1 2-amino-4-hydroxy-6-hydroxymethyldihydropteridine diphosphokinase [Flavobacterium sp. SUN046]
MNLQHQVILSLGSNQGNKLENMQQCIEALHREVGTVIKVSSLYESPAWGFESDPFYNCVLLLHTHFNANKLLKKILKLESKLGRIRELAIGYQARIIDIDIIAFDDEKIESDSLTIPHPFLQQRLFVVKPLQELVSNWIHPISKLSIAEIISQCNDQGSCEKIGKLENPLDLIDLSNYSYIAIEGNIGAGKTTLTNKMAEDFNAKTVLERFADNPFLPKFYKDQNRYAFPLEMSFLADRYQQISDDLAQFDLFKDFIIADYHIFKSLIFAKVTLAEDEYRLYKTLFDIIYKEMPKPDLYIYLYQNTERLLQNIKRRGRSYEQEIPGEYLEKINNGYLDYIKTQKDLNVLIIDVSERDFVKNQEDYDFILNQIQLKINS